jgi:hypothetical protein
VSKTKFIKSVKKDRETDLDLSFLNAILVNAISNISFLLLYEQIQIYSGCLESLIGLTLRKHLIVLKHLQS